MEDDEKFSIEPVIEPIKDAKDFLRVKLLTYINSFALFILFLSYLGFRDNSREAINRQQIQMQEMESSLDLVEKETKASREYELPEAPREK